MWVSGFDFGAVLYQRGVVIGLVELEDRHEVKRTSGGGVRRPRGVLEVRASGPSAVSYRGRSLR